MKPSLVKYALPVQAGAAKPKPKPVTTLAVGEEGGVTTLVVGEESGSAK